jgi:hypothetical protein
MRESMKRRLGLLALLLALVTAPGCRTVAAVTAAVGLVALDAAIDSALDHDHHHDCGRRHRDAHARCR